MAIGSIVVATTQPSTKNEIRMLSDRVLVHMPTKDGERVSRSGILIPETAQIAKRLSWAEVSLVGPLVRSVKTGDQVLFNPDDAANVEVRAEEYLLFRERDIHAVAAERADGEGTGLYL